MSPWPILPNDVVEWFRDLFAEANRKVSETFLNVPSTRETSFDDLFVTSMLPRTAPARLPSGAVVKLDVHNIGGLRRMGGWEVGDIAILVFIIQRTRIIARKVAILQAKRLYPVIGDADDADPVGFRYGMNMFLRRDESPTSMLLTKIYQFDQSSPYGAMKAGSDQEKAIKHFEQEFGASVYYMFYNPPTVPLSVQYPIESYRVLEMLPTLGIRVLKGDAVHALLTSWPEGRSPQLSDIAAIGDPKGGWRMEAWAADLILSCREGTRYESPDEPKVRNLLERRSGPIGAAIMVSIELPPDATVQ